MTTRRNAAIAVVKPVVPVMDAQSNQPIETLGVNSLPIVAPTVTSVVTDGAVIEVPAAIRDAKPKFYMAHSEKLNKQVWIRPCPKCRATGSITQTFRKTNQVQLKKCFACAVPGHPEMNAGKGYQTVGDYERCQRYESHRLDSQIAYAANVKQSLMKMGIPAEAFSKQVVTDAVREQPPIETYDDVAF